MSTPLELTTASYTSQLSSNQEQQTIRSITNKYEVHESTLCRRVLGLTKAHKAAHTYEQKLTLTEEDALVSWIDPLSRSGNPPKPQLVLDTVRVIRLDHINSTSHYTANKSLHWSQLPTEALRPLFRGQISLH